MNEGEVYFALYGDEFDPDDATRIIGMMPTSTTRKAEPGPRHSAWTYSTGKIKNDYINVYEISSSLVSQLHEYEENLLKAKDIFGLTAVFQVVLWIASDENISMPAIGFEPEVISFIHKLGASIDIDTYRN